MSTDCPCVTAEKAVAPCTENGCRHFNLKGHCLNCGFEGRGQPPRTHPHTVARARINAAVDKLFGPEGVVFLVYDNDGRSLGSLKKPDVARIFRHEFGMQ